MNTTTFFKVTRFRIDSFLMKYVGVVSDKSEKQLLIKGCVEFYMVKNFPNSEIENVRRIRTRFSSKIGQKSDIRFFLTNPPTYIRLYPFFTNLPTYPNFGYPLWRARNWDFILWRILHTYLPAFQNTKIRKAGKNIWQTL